MLLTGEQSGKGAFSICRKWNYGPWLVHIKEKMKTYYRYRAEDGEEWFEYCEKGENLLHISPQGHPAVTIIEEPPADLPLITLRPATRYINERKGDVILRDQYYVDLINVSGSEMIISRDRYSWEDALNEVAKIRGLPFERVKIIWSKKGFIKKVKGE